MRVATLFHLTATVILIQIALGGLVTFGFIIPIVHMVWGTLVVVVAIVTAVTALRSKPLDRQLRGVALGMIFALAVQVSLGFTILALGSEVVAWLHLVLGVLIYGMALSGMSFAQRQEHMSAAQRSPEAAVVPR
jgi:heme A synthase